MKKNLNTADSIVKLVLSVLVIIIYFTGVITGPFAHALLILSLIIVVIFVAKIVITKYFSD